MKNRILGLAAMMAGAVLGTPIRHLQLGRSDAARGLGAGMNRAQRRGRSGDLAHSALGRGKHTVAQAKRDALKQRNRRRNKQ